jgi:hypothetical protein
MATKASIRTTKNTKQKNPRIKPATVLPQKNWASHQMALKIIQELADVNDVFLCIQDDAPVIAKAIRDYRSEERKVN